MDKELALKNAQDFIQEIIIEKTNINLDKPFFTKLSQRFFDADPNLEIMKSELEKIGYNIQQDSEHKTLWNISKIIIK